MDKTPVQKRVEIRLGIRGEAWLALALVGALCGCAYLDNNFRPVSRGELYRSGQMSSRRLAYVIEKSQIQTVVSLRGIKEGEDWREDELAACARLGVEHHEIPLTMRALPPPEALSKLLDIYAHAPRPVLVHCQMGIHRAGVASAVFLLARGASVEDARGQLGLFFNDAPIGRLLDLYEGSDKPFAEWVKADYPDVYAREVRAAQTKSQMPLAGSESSSSAAPAVPSVSPPAASR